MPFNLDLLHVLPDDDSPKSLRNWRIRVFVVGCASFLALALIVFPAMFGVLPKLGQLAWANDVAAEVDTKVKAAIAPIQEQVDRIEDTVNQQVEDSSEVIIGLLASELRAAAAARCRAPAGERERENQRITELQGKYLKRAGRQYDIPNCNEL